MKRQFPGAIGLLAILITLAGSSEGRAQVAIHGETIYTMAGEPIKDGLLVIKQFPSTSASMPVRMKHW